MLRIVSIIAAFALSVPAFAGTDLGNQHKIAFDACMSPIKGNSVVNLDDTGWHSIENTEAKVRLGRYLAMANSENSFVTDEMFRWGANLALDFPFESGDVFFLNGPNEDFLWLRYEGERLVACTLVAIADIRSDVLLAAIPYCKGWLPRSKSNDQMERWSCIRPIVSHPDRIDQKLTPTVFRIPTSVESQRPIFGLQVRVY